jgi:peptidoglycan/xylan/chitin deacetylase (PgdA/CDA1 family)
MPATIVMKKALSPFLKACGLFSALEHYRLRNKAFVLMYHRVLTPDKKNALYVQPGMYVTDSSFERQISFLKKKYRIFSLEELIGKINRHENVGGCCAITFDDGWRDNYTNAFPVLKKFQAPATIFLATSYIGTNRLFWTDEICLMIEQFPMLRNEFKDVSPLVLKFHHEIGSNPSGNRDIFLHTVLEVLKKYSTHERDEILAFYRRGGESPCLPREMLRWEEAAEMGKSGLVAFGAHTAEHEILDQVPIAKVRTEIMQSREIIGRRLGVNACTFAYPNGNYNQDIQKILLENQFVGAVTTRKGFLGHNTPLMEIPRIAIHEDISGTVPLFQGRILLEKF